MRLNIELCGVDVTVDFDYFPASRGSRDSYGQQMEPDEPAGFEINAVACGKQDIMELLSDRAFCILNEKICDAIDSDAQDTADAKADFAYEEWRERQWAAEEVG